MQEEFRQLLLDTLREVKNHPDGDKGVAFITNYDEEPDWEVALVFRPKAKEEETQEV